MQSNAQTSNASAIVISEGELKIQLLFANLGMETVQNANPKGAEYKIPTIDAGPVEDLKLNTKSIDSLKENQKVSSDGNSIKASNQSRRAEKRSKRKKQVDQTNMNGFKAEEKRFKAQEGVKTDFSGLIDFRDANLDLQNVDICKLKIGGYDVFKIGFPSGVYVIKNILSIEEQLEIGRRSLNEFIYPPQRTNLFIYEGHADWKQIQVNKGETSDDKKQSEEHVKDRNKEDQNDTQTSQDVSSAQSAKGNIQIDSNFEDIHIDSKKVCSSNTAPNPKTLQKLNKQVVNDYSKYQFDHNMRWANLGMQQDWDNRQQPPQNYKMPAIIAELTDKVKQLMKDELNTQLDYKPDAAMLNFYDKKDYMTGHLDDGEEDQRSPIFSFSLGLSCVFLIGDRNKDFKPLALRLDSGDVAIMSGQSRNCYHGVPRIIEDSFDKEAFVKYINENGLGLYEGELEVNKDSKKFTNKEFHVINYFKENRLNLNFRQVYAKK